MGFDIGAGLSSMGTAIANQAGVEALTQQRADLEAQSATLASQLAEGRETRLMGTRAQYDKESDDRREKGAMDRATMSEDRADKRQGSQHKNTLEEISARSRADINEAAARHGFEASDFAWVETDDATGKKFGVSRDGKKVDLGITGPNDADEKLLARAERFAQVRKTSDNQDTGEKVTEDNIDPVKAAEYLTRQGRGDLAKAYAAPKAPDIPAPPKGLPSGSQYSPSRKQWRDPAGKIYDLQGNPLGGGKAAPQNAASGLINMPVPGL